MDVLVSCAHNEVSPNELSIHREEEGGSRKESVPEIPPERDREVEATEAFSVVAHPT